MDFLAATSMSGLEERLKEARENNDAEELWEILNESGEEFLEWRQALAHLPEEATRGQKGRGKPPRLRRVAVAAPRIDADVGAEPAALA
eukprot:3296309-Alexandrium_andersonii.AAC.1